MAFDETLAIRIRNQLAGKKNVAEKKMFGGVGFLLNGNMMVGIWRTSLIVRLGPQEGPKAIQEPFVGAFDITGRAMKGWALVQPAGLADDDQLKGWIERSLNFVRTLPKK
jgi:TfoX/Sxy family transcriptional regulator of competence genes